MALALAGVVALLWLLDGPSVAHADPGILYVAPDGDDANTCDSETNRCETIQRAVDVASPGDVIKVATGVYSDVHGRPAPSGYPDPPTSGIITQVVYISKTVIIRGGYTTTNWTTPYPITQPTTLDAQRQGRGLLVAGDPSTSPGQAISPTIEGLHITGGDADGLGGAPGGSDAGSGVYVITATATISNNRVFSNTAKDYLTNGGGLYLYYNDATLNDNTFTANTAEFGGGLYLWYSNAMLTNNTISTNTAHWDGGGLVLYKGDATFISNTITANTVDFYGGGLSLLGCTATLTNNTVISNVSASLGAGGGGIYVGYSNVTLTNNTVVSNTAVWSGGGLLLIDSDATLNGNTVSANIAERGGGLFLENWPPGHAKAMLNGNTVTYNTASSQGGGLRLSYNSDTTLVNNLVADNRSSSQGSGLYIAASSPCLLHTTIARNSGGDGSGVYVTDYWWGGTYITSTVVMTNTILVSHTVGISVTGGNTVTVNSILWHGTPITVSQAATATVTVQNQYQGDPRFAADGYHLMAGSAAIDKGVDVGVTTDIDGDSRPRGFAPDLGADEFVSPSAPDGDVYLPLILKNASP